MRCLSNARLRGAAKLRGAASCCVLALASLALANCAGSSGGSKSSGFSPSKYGVKASTRVVEPGQPVPKGGGTYRVGRPYVIAGRTYYPSDRPHRSEGVASWYGTDFHGRLTANGEVYDMHGISAAHPTMPMPSYARVTNMRSGRSVIVRVNDRGPYHENRVIDLSSKAAELLQFRSHGLSRVRVEYVGPAPLEGSDDRRLLATVSDGRPAPLPSQVRIASAKPFVPEAPEPRAIARRGPERDVLPVAVARGGDDDIERLVRRSLRNADGGHPASGSGVAAGRGLY
jgi:rare lipoprotein A